MTTILKLTPAQFRAKYPDWEARCAPDAYDSKAYFEVRSSTGRTGQFMGIVTPGGKHMQATTKNLLSAPRGSKTEFLQNDGPLGGVRAAWVLTDRLRVWVWTE